MAQQFRKPVIEEFQADDYRAFFDSEVFRVWHLRGQDRTYKIARLQRITSEYMGKVEKKPLVTLEDSKGRTIELPFVVNKTNSKTLAQLYGKNPHGWVGKLITLYPTTTDSRDGTVDCIRVRPMIPGKAATKTRPAARVAAQPVTAPAPVVADSDEPSDTDDDTDVFANGAGDSDDQADEDTDDEPPPGALATDAKVLRAEDVIQ